MRYLRLVIGGLLIVGALVIIVREQMVAASANAFVNAPVITVRSPVAGDVAMPDWLPGSVVTEDVWLATIRDPLVDRVRLNDLEMERDWLQAEARRLRERASQQEKYLSWMTLRLRSYRTGRIQELQTRAQLPDLIEPDKLEDEAEDTALDIVARAPDEDETARENVEGAFPVAPSGRALPDLQLGWAGRNIFLDDTANPVWNHALRKRDAQLALAASKSDLAAAEARLSAVRTRIVRERQRVLGLDGGDLTSPVTGLVWERMASDGINVQRGDPILRIADCEGLVVSLSVAETVYNGLKVGDPASFRFSGRSEVMQGRVTRLAGAGAGTVYREMAVAPSLKHLERYDVTLVVPALLEQDDLGCNIGRTGRVFFDDRPLNILRRFWN